MTIILLFTNFTAVFDSNCFQIMVSFKCSITVVIVCLLHVFSILLFLRGFFPTNNSSVHNNAGLIDLPIEYSELTVTETETFNASELYSPIVGRVVLLVIDALREDFLFGDKHIDDMPYLWSLTNDSRRTAMRFTAKVHSPTVTLPRIKALTSGTIPGFIDVIINFNSAEFLEDNFIEQAFRDGRRLVFYGDDTWIKLFPRQFQRSEGTSSFYVNDFHEVDDNVTRHLESDMLAHDWDILILHYLGLDHIGHVFGPQSELIAPKLREMDQVIQRLHEALLLQEVDRSRPPLLVICGDHGMSDAGGHGGSSHSETTIPLVFISDVFQGSGRRILEKVHQIDVAASISVLLGLPIPRNNLGRLLPSLFSGLNWRRRLYLYKVNAVQLLGIAGDNDENCIKDFQEANQKHADWLIGSGDSSKISSDPNQIAKLYNSATGCFSKTASMRVTGYDEKIILLSIVLHWILLFYVIKILINYLKNIQKLDFEFKFLIGGIVLHALSFASTSFIEEEHQTWYFLSTTFFLLSAFTTQRTVKHLTDVNLKFTVNPGSIQMLAAVILFRMARCWNATGDKWAHLEDVGDVLNKVENKYWLSCFVIVGLFVILWLRAAKHGWLITSILLVTFTITYLHHAANALTWLPFQILKSRSDVLLLARMNFWLILLTTCVAVIISRDIFESGVTGWTALSVLLLRPHNIPLVAFWVLIKKLLDSRYPVRSIPVFVFVCLGQAAFFQQGNANNLARIELRSGYVGLEEYNPVIVGILLIVSTYSGPVLWILCIFSSRSHPRVKRDSAGDFPSTTLLPLIASRILPWSVYMVVVYTQRYHLFVWTVFSPKLLYEGVLSLVYVILIFVAITVRKLIPIL